MGVSRHQQSKVWTTSLLLLDECRVLGLVDLNLSAFDDVFFFFLFVFCLRESGADKVHLQQLAKAATLARKDTMAQSRSPGTGDAEPVGAGIDELVQGCPAELAGRVRPLAADFLARLRMLCPSLPLRK